jgi:hypothetical protein
MRINYIALKPAPWYRRDRLVMDSVLGYELRKPATVFYHKHINVSAAGLLPSSRKKF